MFAGSSEPMGGRTEFGGIAATASGYTYVTGMQRAHPYTYAPGVFAQGPNGDSNAVIVRYGP